MNNYNILPFLWLKGESQNRILTEIDKIYDSGLRAFCVESRTHPQFCGDGWWKDMTAILERAKQKQMKVWVLDAHIYPSGYANGAILDRLDLRAVHIKTKNVDIVGPCKNAKVKYNFNPEHDETVLATFVARRTADVMQIDGKSVIDVSASFKGDTLYYDFPEGKFRVIFVVKTTDCAERPYYIDMLNPESTDLMIEKVYQPHFEHFGEEFGKTFAGFFTDEPRFSNGYANLGVLRDTPYENRLGSIGYAYPWSDVVSKELAKYFQKSSDILSLWYEINEQTPLLRCRFMDIITKEYARNFSGKLGAWCKEHGVLYSGHVIEDSNSHVHMGCSGGHYFRNMHGQDVSGVDIVLHQLLAYENDLTHIAPICGGIASPVFFNNTLLKLASSDARLDEKKQGKALCEIFGAYGWGESMQTMKWLLNESLVNGINWLIPHAFALSATEEDCPPHFYSEATNPQFKAFGTLMDYASKMTAISCGSETNIKVGVLYHAEADWSGKDYLSDDVICKVLGDNQIDCDIVPYYTLEKAQKTANGLKIGIAEYEFLIVPFSEYLPDYVVSEIEKAGKNLKVLYVCDGKENDVVKAQKVNLSDVAEYLFGQGVERYFDKVSDLRVRDMQKDGKRTLFVFNQSKQDFNGKTFLKGKFAVDDLIANTHYVKTFGGNDEITVSGGQMLVLSQTDESEIALPEYKTVKEITEFDLFTKPVGKAEFGFYKHVKIGFDLNSYDELPSFVGELKFVAKADMKRGEKLHVVASSEGVTCGVNSCEVKSISSDFIADSGIEKDGEQEIVITLANLKANGTFDYFSSFEMVEGTYLEKLEIVTEKN